MIKVPVPGLRGSPFSLKKLFGFKMIEETGIFSVFSGAEIQPHSQWNLGDFFPNFEKKIPSSIILRLGFSFSQHTHKLHGDILLQFSGNSMCNS